VIRKQGISLLELLIIVVITGVLATIGFTSFSSSVKSQQLQNGINQIAYALREAKYYARAKGVVTTLNINPGNTSFNITANGETLTSSDHFDAFSGKLPDNIIIVSNSCPGLNFSVEGTFTDNSGNTIYNDCSITLEYNGGPQKTLTIKGKIGDVE